MHRIVKLNLRRVFMVSVVASLAFSLVVPAIATAAIPVPTLALGVVYQPKATSLKISGYVGKPYIGKRVQIQIKKPGRTYWSVIATPKVDSYGRYKTYYTPKLAGRFYIRTKFVVGTAYKFSRTASFIVARGPGVKFQILLASTTSTRDSGLFEAILPAFLHDCPEYTMKGTFVGSGAAIALGGTGDADVLLTHSPAAERDFMRGIVAGKASAYRGKTRYKVMYNDYVMVGSTANPAGMALTESAAGAFGKIASTQSDFWSRNDNSGTNAKEKEIWASIGNPQIGQAWYKASGTMGMAQALSAVNNGGGYTLSDRATWLNAKSLGSVPNLKITNEGDAKYFNQYSVIEVLGARNWEGAQDFSQWIRTPRAQGIIRDYGLTTYGTSLFFPNAGSYAAGQ